MTVSLRITNAAKLSVASSGSFALSGVAANLIRSGLLQAQQGSFALVGKDASLINGTSLLKLNFNFGPSWASAPASYTTALATAQAIIQNAFPLTDATINIEMGYGFFDETDFGTAQTITANNSGSGILYASSVPYSTIRAAMAAIANPTATLTAVLNNTPAGSSLNGQSSFQLPSAIAKILGIFGPGLPSSSTDVRRDGAIGMGSGWSDAKLVGVCIHEIRHTMGCVTAFAPFVFSRFTSAAVRDFTPSTAGAYLSIDNGATRLADYDNSNDFSDFLNGPDGTGVQDPNDCFGAFQTNSAIQNLTTLDLQLMNALGFQ